MWRGPCGKGYGRESGIGIRGINNGLGSSGRAGRWESTLHRHPRAGVQRWGGEVKEKFKGFHLLREGKGRGCNSKCLTAGLGVQ